MTLTKLSDEQIKEKLEKVQDGWPVNGKLQSSISKTLPKHLAL